MDFLGIATWIFDFLVLQMLPLVSMILLAVGIFGVIERIPETVTNFSKRMGSKMAGAFRRK